VAEVEVGCGVGQFYDGLMELCTDCVEVCTPGDPASMEYCRKNCPDFYLGMINQQQLAQGYSSAVTSRQDATAFSASQHIAHTQSLHLGLIIGFAGILLAIATIAVIGFVLIRRRFSCGCLSARIAKYRPSPELNSEMADKTAHVSSSTVMSSPDIIAKNASRTDTCRVYRSSYAKPLETGLHGEQEEQFHIEFRDR
jgi:hypothetical protein